MPQRASKRRKLSHSDSEAPSDDGPNASPSPGDEFDGSDNSSHNGDMHDGMIAGEEELGSDNEDTDMDNTSPANKGEIPQEKEPTSTSKRRVNGTSGQHMEQRRGDKAQGDTYTGEIYKSNLFKLQVDELLDQVRLKYGKREASVENALRTLKTIIERIPDREPLSVADAERSLSKFHKVAVPFPSPRPPKDANYKLSYAKPANINAAGSYPLKTATKAGEEIAVDLIVTLPPSIFQEKDYLNHRYFYKRAYYIACIAAGIVDAKTHGFALTFDRLNGNHFQPIIVVSSTGDSSEGNFSRSAYCIHIIPAIPEGVFAIEKTLPDKNCVRPKTADGNAPSGKLAPTPFYNATLRADGSITAYLKLLHDAAYQCEAYRDACLLGRVWLRQRGMGGSNQKGGFGNFEWASMIALLLQSNGGPGAPKLSPGYSSYQLFKATLQFLASKDLIKHPHRFQAADINLPQGDGTPVFFDGPRGTNILFKMTPWSYRLLQQEARTTMSMLGESVFDHFESTFILRADPPLYKYDFVLEVPISSLTAEHDEENHDMLLLQSCRKLYTTLSRGLGDRVTLISVQLPEERGWQIGSRRMAQHRGANVSVCFIVEPANTARAVDHGPSAEDKKDAAAFRQFWGERAELRRFKDGSILESLVWSAKESGPSVFEQIVIYVLARHLGKDIAEQAKLFGNGYLRLLPSVGSGIAPFQPLTSAFTALERDIRALEGLPLQIRHVFAADAQLRYASVEPPLSASRKLMSEPAGVVIEFEGSGRWPDDLIAIQRTKIAFLMKLGELLEESIDGVTARVGLENEHYDVLNQSFLDIVYPSGAAFRSRIRHDREQTLLERRLKDRSLGAQNKEETARALATCKREFIRLPSHTQALQTLCTRYHMLSSSIRLVKKWFSSHLLASHFAPELIELFVARTFLQPYPWQAPSSPMTGFLRTLFFLSRWDWRSEPLVVDFSGEMKAAEFAAIATRFEAWRKIDPALHRVVLFAASNVDPEGTTWTDNARPAKVVAARMTALAKAACQAVREQSVHVDLASLFVSPLEDYDFVIRLSPRFTAIGHGKKAKDAVKGQFKNLQLQASTSEARDLVGYNPAALFLTDLTELYGHAMVLFHGEGADVITGLWSPSTARRPWKVKLGYSSMPVAEEGTDVEINKDAILNEVARLGGELVHKIEVNGC